MPRKLLDLKSTLLFVAFVIVGACGTDASQEGSTGGSTNRTLEACLSGESGLPESLCPAKDPFVGLLAAEKMNECKGQNLVYDRNNNVCTEAKLGTFDCTFDGVKAAFASTISQIEAQLIQSLGNPENPDDIGDGYLFDQCGLFDNGEPIVFLVKLESSEPPKVLVRKLSTGDAVTKVKKSTTTSESTTTDAASEDSDSTSTDTTTAN